MGQLIPLFQRIKEKKPASNCEGRIEKFFMFTMSNKVFAVPAADVSEVINPSAVITKYGAPDYFSGVINVRGRVIPIVNIRTRLHLPEDFVTNRDSKFMLMEPQEGFFIGFAADTIEFRLKEGIIAPKSPSDEDENITYAIIDEKRYPVFFADMWLKNDEFEFLRKASMEF